MSKLADNFNSVILNGKLNDVEFFFNQQFKKITKKMLDIGLSIATEHAHFHIAEYLLSKVNKITNNHIYLNTIAHGNLNFLKKILEEIKQIQQIEYTELMMYAVSYKKLDIYKYLDEKITLDQYEKTISLNLSIHHDALNIAQFLILEKNLDINLIIENSNSSLRPTYSKKSVVIWANQYINSLSLNKQLINELPIKNKIDNHKLKV